MKQIFGNLKKYWYAVLIIILLLLIQAFCDLSLPDYTSNIIDVGISNSGVEHGVPEYLTEEGYMTVASFMTEEELKEWKEIYTFDEKNKRYELKETDRWQELDERFNSVIAVAFMMTSQSQSGDGNGPDMAKMAEYGIDMNSPTLMLDIRKVFKKEISTLGDSMISSMSKQFAKAQYEACHIDIDKLQTNYLWQTGGKMLAMALLMAIVAILVGYFASRVAAGVGRDLRGKIYKKVIGFSNAELDKFSTASLITRSTNDVQQIQQVTVFMLRMVMYAPILAIGGIINIQRYNSGMSWIIVLAIAAVLCLIVILMAVAMPKFKIMQDKVDRVNLVSREILTGLPVIRAFSRERREEERFDAANSDLTRNMLFVNRCMSIMMPALMFIMNGVSVLIVWVGSKRIDSGVMGVGALTAFITYAILIIMSFLMLTAISIMLPRAAVAANRIQEILDSEDIIVDATDAKKANQEDATVVFDHVCFKYPDGEENVLQDIDFVAKPGQTTAIIGSTGAGKSTLVKLIPRFFDVSEGSISVGGIDIRNLTIDSLRGEIGYVPQKGILFSGDIKSNIVYGAGDATRNQIEEAADIAQAREFIEDKEDKYDSHIAQGGTNVSGGQKQRLSIARAIARNPKIYIFDDSFSALDFKTDTALRKALEPKIKDATVFIVAQRVSTILNADQIIVLEDGQMVGKGTHRELVENCETYRQIAESQLSEAEFAASIAGKEEC
ncbi:MAG: ABC transporter ATP-binding protein [Agathobacter sp.]|nr:ABC transporter ATP-binding protein [Agathobacter sp.]